MSTTQDIAPEEVGSEHRSITMQRYLRLPEVIELTGVSRATIYRWQRRGIFPKSRKMGPQSVGFVEAEVREWMKTRPETGPEVGVGA